MVPVNTCSLPHTDPEIWLIELIRNVSIPKDRTSSFPVPRRGRNKDQTTTSPKVPAKTDTKLLVSRMVFDWLLSNQTLGSCSDIFIFYFCNCFLLQYTKRPHLQKYENDTSTNQYLLYKYLSCSQYNTILTLLTNSTLYTIYNTYTAYNTIPTVLTIRYLYFL